MKRATGIAGLLLLASAVAIAQPRMERTLQGGLTGRWWADSATAQRIRLTAEQQNQMDEIFQQNRLKLIDLTAALDKEEVQLEPLVEANQPDVAKIRAQTERIVQARAELERANAGMLLSLRLILSAAQWKELRSGHTDPRPRAPKRSPVGELKW